MPQDKKASIGTAPTAGTSTSAAEGEHTSHNSGESSVDAVLGRRHIVAERVKKLEELKAAHPEPVKPTKPTRK